MHLKSGNQGDYALKEDLQSKNKVICFYPCQRVGRGSIVVFDISSNDELHMLMTQWLDIVPASFDLYPLATPSETEKLLL